MKAIVKNPNEKPTTVGLKPDTLSDLQAYVGGYVTCFYVPGFDDAGITAWASDEGLLMGQALNLVAAAQPIVGPVVFTGHDGEGETTGLTEPQAEKVLQFLEAASL